ncbi:MAG: hypothetical protein IPH07_24680 [Deltaproteobacteria bacterium]|nr:hypothetical protein [Deltaproteobacteria bacterium]
MTRYARNKLILVKIESTEGTDPTPTVGSNAISVRRADVTPVRATNRSRDKIRNFFGNSPQMPADVYSEIEIEVELSGSGAAGTAPAWAPLLQACGFSETVNAGTSVVYAPETPGVKTVTIYPYVDAVRHKMTGCRGTVRLSATREDIPVLTFTLWGVYNAAADSTPGTATFANQATPVLFNRTETTVDLLGETPCLESFALDLANRLSHRNLINCEDRIAITGRSPQGSAQFEAPTVATYDWFAAAKVATTDAVELVHGTTAGNIVTLEAPAVQVINPRYANAPDDVVMIATDLLFLPSTGNDEITLTLT